MNPLIRKAHRVAGPWIFLVLLVSLTTGLTYRIGRSWFGMSRDLGHFFMEIHTGEWMGDEVSPLYVLLVGVATLALLASGAVMLFKSRGKGGARTWHRILAWILLLPLTATVATGVLYKIGEEWFGISEDTEHLLMDIHEGGWLGKTWKPFYVLFLGLGLLVLGLSGLKLSSWWKKRS